MRHYGHAKDCCRFSFDLSPGQAADLRWDTTTGPISSHYLVRIFGSDDAGGAGPPCSLLRWGAPQCHAAGLGELSPITYPPARRDRQVAAVGALL